MHDLSSREQTSEGGERKGGVKHVFGESLFRAGNEHCGSEGSINVNKDCINEENKCLTFCSWNVNGLISKLTDPDFVNYITSFDICVITETFTMPTFDFSVHFHDFLVLHSPASKLSRQGRHSGGVVMLIRRSLQGLFQEINCLFSNMLCVKFSNLVFGTDKDVMFIGIYNHPSGSAYYVDKDFDCTLDLLEEFLLNHMESRHDCYYLITGDLNARIGNWNYIDYDEDDDFEDEFEDGICEMQRRSEDGIVNTFGKSLIQLCSTFQFIPLNGFLSGDERGKFTFISERGNSTIDYFISSVDLLPSLAFLKVSTRIESQHMPVELQAGRKTICEYATDSHENDKIIWDKDREEEFVRQMKKEESRAALEEAMNFIEHGVDFAVAKFVSLLLRSAQCMRRTVCSDGRVAHSTNRWFDKQCRQKKKELCRSLNRYRRTMKTEHRTEYVKLRATYQLLIKERKKAYKQQVRENLLNSRNDSAQFWKTIRGARKQRRQHTEINIELWKEHFEHLLESQIEPNSQHSSSCKQVFDSELDKSITEAEVRQSIRKLKNNKAAGIDGILSEFLKSAEDQVAPFLTKLFNHLFDQGIFPEDWCKSVIVPLYKKGDPSNPGNYRGISLLSILSKVFTSIINQRLYMWAEEESKLCEEQAGFRKRYATTDHIFTLTSIIKQSLYGNKTGKLYVCFVDFMKAFDTVNRDSLWLLLQKIETSTKMLKMLQGIYCSVQSCVKWGNEISEFFHCSAGLKQGCMLSPLMFSLLITNVAEKVIDKGKHGFQCLPGLQEIFLLLFADDICLISTTVLGLQNQLNNLVEASKPFGLKVNLSKTKIMIFRKGGHLAKYEKWFLNQKEIEVVNNYKYLGFTLTTKLSYDLALEEYARKAKRQVVEILKTMWSLGNMEYSVFFKLFDAQTKPLLLYASEIWGLNHFHLIEKIHLFACKRFLHVYPKTPNAMVYGELGRYPLFIDSCVNSVRYWFKLQNMNMCRLPKQAFIMQKNKMFMYTNEKYKNKNWAFLVKKCFDDHGFSEVWLNGGVGNEREFLKILRLRMIDCYKQNWYSKLNSSERFLKYSSFKSLLQPERYLFDLQVPKFRNLIVKFRLGLIELKVNNRYENTNQTCSFCSQIEDEDHFVLHCPKYDDLRKKFIEKYYDESCLDAFSIFRNRNFEAVRSLGLYLYYAMKRKNGF